MQPNLFALCIGVTSTALFAACTPTTDATNSAKPRTADTPREAAPMSNAKVIAPDAPLEEGLVTFQGMVRGTKGGFYVGRAVADDGEFSKALAALPEAKSPDSEWFLGAIVKVTGIIQKHESKPQKEGEPIEQMRSGTWFELERIDSVSVVKPAEMIAGPLVRSKGFFAVGKHLISADDVSWSLAPNGGKEGDRVRFYGQSRTVVCEPNAQCLTDGSLPLFDVARAERVR